MSQLASGLDELAAADPAALPADAQADDIAELMTLANRLDAEITRRIAALDAAGGPAGQLGGAQAWLRHRCRLSPGQARARVRAARRLVELPALAAAHASGEVSAGHVVAVAEAATLERREAVAAVEAALVDLARQASPREVRVALRRLRSATDPEADRDEADRLHARRRLHVSPTLDGAVAVDGLLDADSGEALIAAIDALDRPDPAGTPFVEQRCPAQRRADALGDLARAALAAGDLPDTGGQRPHINVHADLAALTGAGDAGQPADATATSGPGGPCDTGGPRGPGEPANGPASAAAPPRGHLACLDGLPGAALDRAGPVASATARRIACDAGIARVLTRGPSEILDIGRRTATVPAGIRRALHARDRGCRGPACDRPANWCDAHHLRHWADGGPTALTNLALLCRRCHRLVHERRWRIHLHDDATATWTDPDGRTWTTHPHRGPP